MCLILNKKLLAFSSLASRQKNMHSCVPLCMKQHEFICSVSSSETMISGSGPRALLHISCLLLLGVGGGRGPVFKNSQCSFSRAVLVIFDRIARLLRFIGSFPLKFRMNQVWVFFLSPITKVSSSTRARGHGGTNLWLVFHRCLRHYDLNPISSRENKMILTCGN